MDRLNDSVGLVIVGSLGGTHLGSAFASAAERASIQVSFCDVSEAYSSLRYLNSMCWRYCDRMPPLAARLHRAVRSSILCTRRPILLTTGLAPVTAEVLSAAVEEGCILLHFSSDDPWNPEHFASWHHRALPLYDIIFTPRRSNLEDFRMLGCHDVRYLPFGFDPAVFPETCAALPTVTTPQVLFVGGADKDRVGFFRNFIAAGGDPAFVGGQWEKHEDLKGRWLGELAPRELHALSLAATINLILVRRSNRDGHTMRSFEAGAIGGCLAVENTEEHREIFGQDGETVRYFNTPSEAAEICLQLTLNSSERVRLASAVRHRIRNAGHTYGDRLRVMLEAATEVRAASADRRLG